ncbi:hypothetical protein C1H46_030211 [Malus baccata]|uniref:Uncharacterized protein n=1 Tax=Malus baccata TaxID=106549 RepID=A0A540LCN3_MALBA|nr:hypothetical protein C1H46_030211 [Malus baccata]
MLKLAKLLHHKGFHITFVNRESIRKNFLAPLLNLLKKLNDRNPPVTCMVSDGFMTSTITTAKQLGIPIVFFFPFAAAGFMGSKQYPILVEKGLAPLKGEKLKHFSLRELLDKWIFGDGNGLGSRNEGYPFEGSPGVLQMVKRQGTKFCRLCEFWAV